MNYKIGDNVFVVCKNSYSSGKRGVVTYVHENLDPYYQAVAVNCGEGSYGYSPEKLSDSQDGKCTCWFCKEVDEGKREWHPKL